VVNLNLNVTETNLEYPFFETDIPLEIFPAAMGRRHFNFLTRDLSDLENRRLFTKYFSWAVPDRAAIELIARLPGVVELGAGTGLWARLVANAGGDIRGFDYKSHREGWDFRTCHFKISNRSVYAIRLYEPKTLLLVWPPLKQSFADRALQVFKGDTLVYVGERRGGCTADTAFFDRLDRGWNLLQRVAIPRWESMYDSLFVYTRKNKIKTLEENEGSRNRAKPTNFIIFKKYYRRFHPDFEQNILKIPGCEVLDVHKPGGDLKMVLVKTADPEKLFDWAALYEDINVEPETFYNPAG